MPIFHHDLGSGQGESNIPRDNAPNPLPKSPPEGVPMERKLSEESIRTEYCEGLALQTQEELDETTGYSAGVVDTGFTFPLHGTYDRIELMARLKNGESPTWLPNRNLESLLHESTPKRLTLATINPSPLLASPEILEPERTIVIDIEPAQAGLQIERPRSALHSGDFTEGPQSGDHGVLGVGSDIFREPWIATSPPRNFSPFQLDSRFPAVDRIDTGFGTPVRAPSLSSSYSSSFFLKPPTSPLVQSESNDDLELSSFMNPIDITPNLQNNYRRHTLQSSHSMHSTGSIPTTSSLSRPLPHSRRDTTFPYQAHQPRRSLTSNPVPFPSSSPRTPDFLRSRRPSYSDSSPLHHASMVGSYEESILRGRMSTNPSKPLDFVAQIGVLGLAVFYSYETTSHGRARKSEDGPSPYVGQIDIENSLPNQTEARDSKRKRASTNIARGRTNDLDMIDGPVATQPTGREIRVAEKLKRRSTSPRAPPGGSYRIPEKGQLQIIIKNPNKTAVKLFLVPYDLAGMEPATKTFIRQRSYSAGPVIDNALSSTTQSPVTTSTERPTLRYLVHLHICSPSRGRFYLYKSIRVVFANRVPDGKEKLRNEISTPEPKFSIYKPGRDSSSFGLSLMSGAGASLAAEKAYRRRSSGFALGPSTRTYESMEGITQAMEKGFSNEYIPDGESHSAVPIQPIPFSLFRKPVQNEEDSGQQRPSNIQSPTFGKTSRPPTSPEMVMSTSWGSNSTGISDYNKLSKGDIGYGGNAFAGSQDGIQIVAEGLLAKKLRDLGVGVPSPDGLNEI